MRELTLILQAFDLQFLRQHVQVEVVVQAVEVVWAMELAMRREPLLELLWQSASRPLCACCALKRSTHQPSPKLIKLFKGCFVVRNVAAMSSVDDLLHVRRLLCEQMLRCVDVSPRLSLAKEDGNSLMAGCSCSKVIGLDPA